MSAEVRRVETIKRFRDHLVRYDQDLGQTLDAITASLHRLQTWIDQELPAYWNQQTRLAERALAEAEERLSQLTASVRPGDRPSATEAKQAVHQCRTRLRLCQDRQTKCRQIRLTLGCEMEKARGPLANVRQLAETDLPAAAGHLQTLLEQLHRYLENTVQSPPPPRAGDSP